MKNTDSILLIGESGVGKTHYGAQLLNRLMAKVGTLHMDGAANNLEPFEAAMLRLTNGKSAAHTPTNSYVESLWPITDSNGRKAELAWPDYGGEQIKEMSASRQIHPEWKSRIDAAGFWLLLIRLQQTSSPQDMLSKPPRTASGDSSQSSIRDVQISDQARIIELLQILLYLKGASSNRPVSTPRLCVLLSCWDELETSDTPAELLKNWLPMVFEFIHSVWESPSILGLSALGRPLNSSTGDEEFMVKGPEQFGYVVLEDGEQTHDLTWPIQHLLGQVGAGGPC